MKILILGAGQVGSSVANNLASEANDITLVDVRAVGAYGRLTLSGREADVEEAAAAAIKAVQNPALY